MGTMNRPKLNEYGIREARLTSRRKVQEGDYVTFRNSFGRTVRAKVSWIKDGIISALVTGDAPAYTEMTTRKAITKIERFSYDAKDYGWTVWTAEAA